MTSRSRSPAREEKAPSPARRDQRSRSRSRSPANDARGDSSSGKRFTGTASRWNERGFCFITPDDDKEDIFCHSSSITDGNCLAEGAKVSYEKVWDENSDPFTNVVRVTIMTLRRKLGDPPLVGTIAGVGYKI